MVFMVLMVFLNTYIYYLLLPFKEKDNAILYLFYSDNTLVLCEIIRVGIYIIYIDEKGNFFLVNYLSSIILYYNYLYI